MKYKDIEALIVEEQRNSNDQFIRGVDLEKYINKIREKAEVISYYIEGECAGFVAFYCNDRVEKNAFITLILVSPGFRGKGISSILLKCVLDICRKRSFKTCSLEVRKNNYAAIRVYSNLGFMKVKEDKDKIVMKLDLC